MLRVPQTRHTLLPLCCRSTCGDIQLVAADGSMQRTHRLVLSCRLPALTGADIPASVQQVRAKVAQVLQAYSPVSD
jgi:hypothetical protein